MKKIILITVSALLMVSCNLHFGSKQYRYCMQNLDRYEHSGKTFDAIDAIYCPFSHSCITCCKDLCRGDNCFITIQMIMDCIGNGAVPHYTEEVSSTGISQKEFVKVIRRYQQIYCDRKSFCPHTDAPDSYDYTVKDTNAQHVIANVFVILKQRDTYGGVVKDFREHGDRSVFEVVKTQGNLKLKEAEINYQLEDSDLEMLFRTDIADKLGLYSNDKDDDDVPHAYTPVSIDPIINNMIDEYGFRVYANGDVYVCETNNNRPSTEIYKLKYKADHYGFGSGNRLVLIDDINTYREAKREFASKVFGVLQGLQSLSEENTPVGCTISFVSPIRNITETDMNKLKLVLNSFDIVYRDGDDFSYSKKVETRKGIKNILGATIGAIIGDIVFLAEDNDGKEVLLVMKDDRNRSDYIDQLSSFISSYFEGTGLDYLIKSPELISLIRNIYHQPIVCCKNGLQKQYLHLTKNFAENIGLDNLPLNMEDMWIIKEYGEQIIYKFCKKTKDGSDTYSVNFTDVLSSVVLQDDVPTEILCRNLMRCLM